jgi:hypothetical protein
VGRRACLDTEAIGKNHLSLPGNEPRSSNLYSDTILTELIVFNVHRFTQSLNHRSLTEPDVARGPPVDNT